jgi:hypothetical protein
MTKGALVSVSPAFGSSVPNVVVFQFNPETLRHSWTQPMQAKAGTSGANPYGVQDVPGESFSFTLVMDATDQLALELPNPQRVDADANGIYSRISALEMLMFPVKPAGALAGASAAARPRRTVPAAQVPAVLFVWGLGRILPVRLTGLTISETLFDDKLNPTRAEAQIELRVLTPDELKSAGPLKDLATAAYDYSQKKRELLALFNLNNASAAIELPPLPGL